MKLTTQITETKEIEITLPVFFKENATWDQYLAVLDEKTVIHLYISKDGEYTSVVHTTPDMKSSQIQKAYNNHKEWSVISEEDFLMAYDDALSAISLRPKLNESFVETLETIGLKANGQ